MTSAPRSKPARILNRLDRARLEKQPAISVLDSGEKTSSRGQMEPMNEEHVKMYFYENRLKTFVGWPFEDDCACTPENMARAGFVHTPRRTARTLPSASFATKS
ncbi:hypothetical protein GJAV_G00141340 [Gymnothorax javanicus]|nr:hypothetical protein GJAV_G00141340 [Gymnothorax javanicus]